jgi:FKBP-type peptidyl-prolyl cis-trans isomerase SlyD
MKVEDGTVVSIRFEMINNKGEVLESILDCSPINYLHGSGNVLPLLETELIGLEAGDKKTIFISKDQGYEDTDEDFTIEVVIDAVRGATEQELMYGQLNSHALMDRCAPGCNC